MPPVGFQSVCLSSHLLIALSHPDVQKFKPTALRMAKAYANEPDARLTDG
jgi:hypothetical protein